jgi:hypothetical protein
MPIAARQISWVFVLLASSAVASASIDVASQPRARISLLDAPRERLTLADDVLPPSFPSLRPPKLVINGAPSARAARPSTVPRLLVDPRLLRWEIDELGGAWFSPSVSGGAFGGRLLFLF